MQMFGKENEGIKTIRPLKDGVIADFQAAEHMIRGMIKMMNQKQRWISPQLKMVICIPSGITEVEKRAVKDSAERSGAKEVYLIHEPMAAAVGIGIDVTQPQGNMIVDIGVVPLKLPSLHWVVLFVMRAFAWRAMSLT